MNTTKKEHQDNEVAGPGGAEMTGGDLTPAQDAGAAASESTQARVGQAKIEEQQQAGTVGQQTQHGSPSAGDPDHGLPGANVDGHSGQSSATVAADAESSTDESSTGDAKKNAESSTELDDLKAQLLHLSADFENFKRQAVRRETEARERAVRGVLEDLLPVLDNFERAVGAAENTADVKSLKVGVEYILQQFQEALKSSGAEPIEAVGQPFDPMSHEALEEIESDARPGTVVQDLQRGYRFRGRVLRPSRVRVAK